MNEIAIRNGQTVAPVVPAAMTPSPLALWALEAHQAMQIAEALARSSFIPQSLRNRPDDVMAAILAGQELGLQPMATLRSMDVIQGTPALRAHAMRGLLQSRGHKMWIEPGASKEKVVMRGQRREPDGSYGEVQESVWDIQRAADMGLTTKPEWKKQPQTMLTNRATGEICRLIAADALYAMPYAVEELDGEPGDQATRVTAAEILGSRQPRPPPDAAPPPDLDGPATADQLRELGIAFGESGIAAHTGKGSAALNDEARFAWLAERVGAHVTSTKDLTAAQAEQALTMLRQERAEAAKARRSVEVEIVRLFDGLDAQLSPTDRLRDVSTLLGRPVQSVQQITYAELVAIAAVLAECDDKAEAWDAALAAMEAQRTPVPAQTSSETS